MTTKWIPPDLLPRREPEEPTPPTVEELDAAYHTLYALYVQTPQDTRDHQYLAGALASADWTTGRTLETPVTDVIKRHDEARDTIFWEAAEADMARMGKRHPGMNPNYALGSMTWLFWVTGTFEKPGWLR